MTSDDLPAGGTCKTDQRRRGDTDGGHDQSDLCRPLSHDVNVARTNTRLATRGLLASVPHTRTTTNKAHPLHTV